MNAVGRAAAAGIVGALTTNVLHEGTRRFVRDAPRVDRLGMQALARMYEAVGSEAPEKKELYRRTLIGDLISNSAYFALVGCRRGAALPLGAALGVAAGLGAAYLPEPLGLEKEPTARTAQTRLFTVLLYGAGGVAAGAALRLLP